MNALKKIILSVLMPPIFSQFLAAAPSESAGDGFRKWTIEASGSAIEASIVDKNADDSRVTLLKKDGKKVPVATALLVPADREVVKKWARGIVLDENVPTLKQSVGGFGNAIDELGVLFKPFDEPLKDTDAHPDAVIYDGPPTHPSLGENCSITYLMPFAKAESLLLKSRGAALRLKLVGPGFPPGLIFWRYDINFGPYNHMIIVHDGAEQVVSLEFISGNAAREMPKTLGGNYEIKGKPIYSDVSGHGDYLDLKDNGGGWAVSWQGDGVPVYVHLVCPGRQSADWYVPKPLVRQILFNVQEKKKDRK